MTDDSNVSVPRNRIVAWVNEGVDFLGARNKPIVDISDVYDGIFVIVQCATGVVFTTQAGGLNCTHPSCEGVLLPLWPAYKVSRDPLRDYTDDELDCPSSPDEKMSRVNAWLNLLGIAHVFTARLDAKMYEAWVPVKIVLDPEPMILRPFGGYDAILTYPNSD